MQTKDYVGFLFLEHLPKSISDGLPLKGLFFGTSVLKEFCILSYLHNNKNMLILMFQN